jgi:hypothetical protein
VLRAAQQLVLLDLKEMLETAQEMMGTSLDQAKSVLKAAYLTYLLLSPYIQRDHFTTDQKVRKNFRAAILTLIASTPYQEEKREATKATVDRLDKVKDLIMEIEREIGEALGDFKSSWQDGPFWAAEHGRLQASHIVGLDCGG